ncbi:hypothetical protein ACSVDA_24365 [Cytobacillus sp. Hm23]
MSRHIVRSNCCNKKKVEVNKEIDVKKNLLCQFTGIDVDINTQEIPAGFEVNIYQSVSGIGRSGLVLIENRGDVDIQAIFIYPSGAKSEPQCITNNTINSLCFENIRDIIVQNTGNIAVPVRHSICIKLDNESVCFQNEPSLMNDILIEPEVTIYKSVLGRGRNGLISIENLNGNSNNIEVTFVSFSGVTSDPILIPQKTARTFSFENVKEIIVSNIGNSIASIEYEICVILDDNLLCLQGEDGSPAYSTNNISGGDERTLYTSVTNKGEAGMISVEGDRSGGNMIEVSLLTVSNLPSSFIILPLNTVTLSFEDIKEIKVKNLGGAEADIAHEICIILDKEIICSQNDPDGFISIPANTEFSIFKSVSKKGERGLLGIEYETTDGDLIITFITVTGLSINPFLLPSDASVSLSFENIKEIKVNNINNSTPEICFELCRVIKH